MILSGALVQKIPSRALALHLSVPASYAYFSWFFDGSGVFEAFNIHLISVHLELIPKLRESVSDLENEYNKIIIQIS